MLDPIHQGERRTRLIAPLRGRIEIHVGRVERFITASECGVCVKDRGGFVFVENAVSRSFLTFEFSRPERSLRSTGQQKLLSEHSVH